MRRNTKSILNLVVFGAVLFTILFANRPSAKHKAFAWNKIRYRTSAPSLPEARGVCPGLAGTSKPALIVSRVSSDGDAKWLDKLAKQYHLCVYTVDAPPDPSSRTLQVPANRAHESMAYLTFLIDNYDALPAAGMVFVHGNRWAWHNDDPNYDNAALLSALNIPAALEGSGYHNLRCDWSLSTCPAAAPPQGSIENSMQAVLQPWSARAASDRALPRALESLFGGTDAFHTAMLGRTETLRAQCCAQFVVSRENVRQHSREEYVALRQWVLDGSRGTAGKEPMQRDAAPRDDLIAGRILSYLWHVLFVRHAAVDAGVGFDGVDLDLLNRQACPSAQDCYCRLYGRCGLTCRGPGSCFEQYRLPKDLQLPADWGETH